MIFPSIPSLMSEEYFSAKYWTFKNECYFPFASFIYQSIFLWLLFWYHSFKNQSRHSWPFHPHEAIFYVLLFQYSEYRRIITYPDEDAPKIMIAPCDENDHYRPHPPAPAFAQPSRLIPRVFAPPPPLLPLPPDRTPWRCAYVVRRCPYITIYIVIMRRKQWIK